MQVLCNNRPVPAEHLQACSITLSGPRLTASALWRPGGAAPTGGRPRLGAGPAADAPHNLAADFV